MHFDLVGSSGAAVERLVVVVLCMALGMHSSRADHQRGYSGQASLTVAARRYTVAHLYLKAEAMQLLATRTGACAGVLTGNGGAWCWLNRTPHVVVSALGLVVVLGGFEIGP